MTRRLKPWAQGPFDVLLHAELHLLTGEEVHKRIAMISFDNAIELSVTVYLSLHPVARGGTEYKREDVDRWLMNYHRKVEFFFHECDDRKIIPICKRDEIIWFHDLRNGQYHSGGPTVPLRQHLDGVRSAAIEVFSVLFDEPQVDELLGEHIADLSPTPPQPRTREYDKLIDSKNDMVIVCGQPEYTSEVLYALDPNRYHEVGLRLLQAEDTSGDEEDAAHG